MNTETWQNWRLAQRCGDEQTAAKLLEQLVVDNAKLIYQCGWRLFAQLGLSSDLSDDVFQAGTIGLLKAFDKWDPTRGRFSTLAHFEIRYEMQRALCHITPITRPRRVVFSTTAAPDTLTFVSLDEADQVAAEAAPEDRTEREEALDRLEAFRATLTKPEQRRLAKHDPEMLRRAREYLEGDE